MAILMESTEIYIFGITVSWTNGDISDEELHITGFSMFRKDRVVGEKTRGVGWFTTLCQRHFYST